MRIEEVRSIVCKAISEVQELSGRKAELLSPEIRAIGDVDGFDSLCSIETTVLIEKQLNIDLGTESIFISPDGRRALTIEQTCVRVHELLRSAGESNE